MDIQNILDILCTIGNLSADEAKKYTELARLNCFPFADKEYSEKETALLEYYIAAKTNYQISLTKGDNEISSFTAGDVSISASNGGNAQANARALFENAYADVAHLAEDKGFYFRGV